VAQALDGARTEESGRIAPLRALADYLRSRTSHGGAVLARLRRGAARVGECVEAVRGAAGQLDRCLGDAGASLTTIASSTSDNSASLIELSASVDEVARSARYLAQHVDTSAASVDQMVASVVEVGDRVEVLAGETNATAEQAEVSRYLSEAIPAVDHNLKDVLAGLQARRAEAGAVQAHLARLCEEHEGQEDGPRALEALFAEFQERSGALGARAAPFAGGEGAG
jgi:methyl-accepting chemotaxis protein